MECLYEEVTVSSVLEEGSQVLEIYGELVLPEDYPDVETIHSFFGYPSEVIGEVSNGVLSLYGQMEAHMVYCGAGLPDRTGEYSVIWRGDNGISYEEKVYLPNTGGRYEWDTDIRLLSMEPVSGHRVKYSGEIVVNFQILQDNRFSMVKELESDSGVETVKDQFTVKERVATVQTSKEIVNQYHLSYPKTPVARVIDFFVKPIGLNAKVTEGRVTVEGQLETTLIYIGRNEDGEESGLEVVNWNEANGGLHPFQISIDVREAANDNVLIPKVWVESIQTDLISPELCRLHTALGVRVEVFRPRTVQAVLDVSPKKNEVLDILRNSWEIEEIIGISEREFVVEKTLSLPANKRNIERILAATLSTPRTVESQVELDRIYLEGELDLYLLYTVTNEEEEFSESATVEGSVWNKKLSEAVTFGEFLEMPGIEDGMRAAVTLTCDGYRVEIVDEESINLTVNIKAKVQVRNRRNVTLVEDCALVHPTDEPRPSMLFYLVQPGDTLWKVARRYNTTMESIAAANNIEEIHGTLPYGKKLLIPKKLA